MQIVDHHLNTFSRRQSVLAVGSSLQTSHDADDDQVIREKIQRGRMDIAAGRVIAGDILEAECEALFG
ncbi:hypothetical protein [Pandoraea sp. ISTKB]|uniref:hypothetical protein n=1 Tax=Pandoraea sp. ISTKB TaxID=1586708 RepID=UPI000846CF44|nr:hypothetical protein [Pandoraea sp. ISTKB]ODP33767.1 hypothetical protein A9762_16870 [Pandoraea sp. ISTKB]